MTKNLLQLETHESETMTMEAYIKLAQKDPSVYASPAKRMLKAIGEPKKVDTSKTPRLSRIFGNRTIRVYEVFSEFYGLEDTVNRIVSFFQHAAQNLEESRQILYLLGPVGSAKSSLVERLKSLMEQEPIFVLADADGNPSPINESPLGVCGKELVKKLKITGLTPVVPSPWATKRLKEYKGDLTKFTVIKRHPSQLEQVALSKVEPGDENNQDISALVGKVDIRKLEHYSQSDADA
jgi:serine protein kinase